jgi:hypothetical protein
MKRLEHSARTFLEVKQYYTARAMQLLYDGYVWSKDLKPVEDWGFYTTFTKLGETFESLYVLEGHRGNGKAKAFLKNSPHRVLTAPSCKIEDFLSNIKKDFIVGALHTEDACYQAIEEFYANSRAKRSQVFLMDHIDQGLGILRKIGASHHTAMGYALHPLFQADQELKNHWGKYSKLNSTPVILAMEYRRVANDYLSTRSIEDISEIKLSPLEEVNHMLIADKIQNYKDFYLYHKDSHPRAKELDKYFHNWFKRLGLLEEFVEETIKEITF